MTELERKMQTNRLIMIGAIIALMLATLVWVYSLTIETETATPTLVATPTQIAPQQ